MLLGEDGSKHLSIEMHAHSTKTVWQRRRYWHMPDPHALLHRARASASAGLVQVHCSILRPALAILQQKQVRESNKMKYVYREARLWCHTS